MRKLAALATAAAGLAVLAVPSTAAPKAKAAKFNPPVKVTPDLGYGYEPTVVTDRFGNLYATAHKENWQLAMSPDSRSATQTRSMSWGWTSYDGGKTWRNLPGLPGEAENRQVGVEGDMAIDDADNVYYVDTYLADNTITVYHASGRGEVEILSSRPVQGTGGLDDRPWITAHGDGHVFYIGNSANKAYYDPSKVPAQPRKGTGWGAGRYAVYASYDGGATFDNVGYPLKDSGWCRPVADHKPKSQYVYVICTNDNGQLYSYVSKDDGKSFDRYDIAEYEGGDATESYPTVEIGKDSTIWVLYVDAKELDGDFPVTNTLRLFSSRDHGKTWKGKDITPKKGRYQYAWLSVAKNGNLGLGVYHRPNTDVPWRVYGAIWKPGRKPVLVSLDEKNPVAPAHVPEPPGDYLMSSFGPDNKLTVIWTRVLERVEQIPEGQPKTIRRDIYSARSR